MIGALWTGISGLSSEQTALDNESNNIANVNTVGYKASRISFADQMYQDDIGKGSKIVDAEKLYTQGNLKLTGVSYDMALSGDGFFTVTNASASGTTENYYTRAGNFRMGENGTLQDANGNEVQGWAMSAIDTDNDVTSTNSNITSFTNDYTKLLTSKIVSHSNYVETFTAKATDYSASAESDSESVFSGAGLKTKSAKISDVEAAISNYTSWLQKLQDTPDGSSISSVAQKSEINFDDSIISKEGDEIYVYIDGNKISQSYIPTTADADLMQEIFDSLNNTDQGTYGNPDNTLSDEQIVLYNQAASKIATYKGLADTISEISGLVAYMSSEVGGTTSDTLEEDDTFGLSTSTADMMKGIIQIKSLIPGEEFVISEVGEVSGSSTIQGDYQTSVSSVSGSGTGAVESARDALAQLISGKQQDVYTSSDLKLNNSTVFTYSINIYDKELKQNIPVPNDGGTPLNAVPIFVNATTSSSIPSVDDIVDAINNGLDANGIALNPKLTEYIQAQNINGNLVVKTLDKNYDADFSSSLKQLPSYNINLNEIVDNSSYSFDLKIDNTDYPININLPNSSLTIPSTYTDINEYIRDQIQTEIDTINTNNPTYLLSITPNVDGAFSIYTANEDITFENSSSAISDNLPSVSDIDIQSLVTPDIKYERSEITITEPLSNIVYSVDIMGETISYDNRTGLATSADDIINNFNTQISANSILSPLIDSSTPSNTLGSSDDGVVLTNGLDNLQDYNSNPSGNFMIELPAGTIDLSLFLYDRGMNDTIQVFTKDGEHIAGTLASSSSWDNGYSPKDIITQNPDKFNIGATYVDNHTSYTLNSPKESSGSSSVSYIDKDGNSQTRTLGSLDEMVVIPNVLEDLVVFINGNGLYDVSAEWGSTLSSSGGSSSLVLEQKGLEDPSIPSGLDITNMSGVTKDNITEFNYESRDEHRFKITTDDTKSASVYQLSIEGIDFEIKTDQTPTVQEIVDSFNNELLNHPDMSYKYTITRDGNDLVIQDINGEFGFTGFSQNSTLNIKSLTVNGDEYKTLQTSNQSIMPLSKNNDLSGRAGAGAEFIEMVTTVNQTASQNSLQLKLDTLGISDSAFGEFSVDSNGLITMTQDGAEIAVGQASIALFTNNIGLEAIGDNLLTKTTQSGDPIYNLNNDKAATIEGQTLELSTADLSESLVNLMVSQRAFEANAKSITTADEILTTLIGLKR